MTKNDFKELSPLEAIHQTASGLYDSGIMEETTPGKKQESNK